MAIVPITATSVGNPYTTPGGTVTVWTAIGADTITFRPGNDDILLFRSAAGAGAATIASVADPQQRTGDVVVTCTAAASVYAWGFSKQVGFADSGGLISITGSGDVEVCIIKMTQ